MKYYKVIKNNKIVDVLDKLVYLKYQKKHNRMILCNESKAQAFFSSDRKHIFHTEFMYDLDCDESMYDNVEIQEIDKFEYEQLKVLNMKSPQEIIDAFVLSLIENEVI